MSSDTEFQKMGRQWLNLEKDLHAFVAWDVHIYPGSASIWADFTVSDCSRKVSLDFGIFSEDPKDIKRVDKKIGVLRKALDDMEEAILRALEIQKAKGKK